MRIVVDNKEEYANVALLQKQVTRLFKLEKDTGTKLEASYKQFINTPIEKSYEKPGESAKVANTSTMDTTDKTLFIAYIVHAAINRKKLAVIYVDGKGNESKRLLEPFNWRNGQVVAWCHERGAWRQFKPSQMLRVAVTDETFDRSEDVEIIAAHAKEMAHLI